MAIDIKTFGDYRAFLRAHFDFKKTSNPHWSYGLWARRLGLKATSSLTKVLNGDREAGDEITSKFIDYFKFSSHEARYFSDLVRLDKIKDDVRLRALLMERMGREHPDAQLKVLDDRSFEIISNWFCMTIREMVRLADFQEDPAWIQQRLSYPVGQSEILQALENLLHQGLLKRRDDGRLFTSEGLLHTTNDVASEAIKKYHEQMLDIAKLSLRQVSVEAREYSAQTITLNSARLPELKQMVREFKAKLNRIFEEPAGDQTYQFQIQCFPLTKELPHEG